MIKKLFNSKRRNGALFLSGTGANAEEILAKNQELDKKSWQPVVIVTDRPEESRAEEIAEKFKIPFAALDIKKFYSQFNHNVSIATPKGREIREKWTVVLRKKLKPYNIDFGILAGFIPLTNLTADFPCLNIHPGDLTVVDDSGRRSLVGLHCIPVEKAILSGCSSLRSSVIIAQSYTDGSEMDSGPLLGISPEVTLDLQGYSVDELRFIHKKRPLKTPCGGHKDILRQIAAVNQKRLKNGGDLVVFYPAILNFVAGRYGLDADNELCFQLDNEQWQRIKTVEYRSKDDFSLIL